MDGIERTMTRTRDRSRRHDIVLWGATGFTGSLVAEYLAEAVETTGARLALGGRSLAKLEALRGRLAGSFPAAANLPLIVADSHDRDSLDPVAAATEVVCTTVGPYAIHGHDLVAACAEAVSPAARSQASPTSSNRPRRIRLSGESSPIPTPSTPRARAVVERRGGMLIHGAIIAREYGLPCVTGVPDVTALIGTGDRLTVDGYLGIVTVTQGRPSKGRQ
jgi:hypothetical protein